MYIGKCNYARKHSNIVVGLNYYESFLERRKNYLANGYEFNGTNFYFHQGYSCTVQFFQNSKDSDGIQLFEKS